MKKYRFFIFLLIVFPFAGFAQKTDKLHLDNGDWITGEIKQMINAILKFKTDAASTLDVKWDRIFQLKSDKIFEVWLPSGVVYYGSLDVPEDDSNYKLLLKMADTDIELDMNEIVQLYPIKNRFWAKVHGNADVGFSYNKGNDIMVLNGSLNVEYRPKKTILSFKSSSNFTDQTNQERTSKIDVGFNYGRMLGHLWAYSAFVAFQQNTELNLQLRSAVGTGVNKILVNTNVMDLFLTGGVVVNREKATSTENKTNNFEGLLKLNFKIFKYRKPEVHLDTYFTFYPSFTVKDRYRTDFNIQSKFKFFKDFYFSISFYHNLDTKPPDENSNSTDWGVNTAIGVTFN